MKRVLFAEVRSYDSSRHHYLLLLIALVQFPLFAWPGNAIRYSHYALSCIGSCPSLITYLRQVCMEEFLKLERDKEERERRKEEREQMKEERGKRKEEREKMLYEQRILATDTTNMDEYQSEYYNSLKASIIEKRHKTGFHL